LRVALLSGRMRPRYGRRPALTHAPKKTSDESGAQLSATTSSPVVAVMPRGMCMSASRWFVAGPA